MVDCMVIVEFFGVPRLRAGQAEVAVPIGSVLTILQAISERCPSLPDLLTADGHLAPHYLLSLDGRAFVTDLSCEVPPGSRLLLLSADAGG